MAVGGGLFKFMNPHKRPQAADIQAIAGWGTVALAGAVWVVQPFDWVKKTFFVKPEPEN